MKKTSRRGVRVRGATAAGDNVRGGRPAEAGLGDVQHPIRAEGDAARVVEAMVDGKAGAKARTGVVAGVTIAPRGVWAPAAAGMRGSRRAARRG